MSGPEYTAFTEASRQSPVVNENLCLASLCAEGEPAMGTPARAGQGTPARPGEAMPARPGQAMPARPGEAQPLDQQLTKLTGLTPAEIAGTMGDTGKRLTLLGGLLTKLDSDEFRVRQNATDALKILLESHQDKVLPYLIYMDRHRLSPEQHHRLRRLIDPVINRETTENGITKDGLGRVKRFNSTDENEVYFDWHKRALNQLDMIATRPEGPGGVPCFYQRQEDGSYQVWQHDGNGGKRVIGAARPEQVKVYSNGALTITWRPNGAQEDVTENYHPRRR